MICKSALPRHMCVLQRIHLVLIPSAIHSRGEKTLDVNLICRVFFSPVSTFDPVDCYVPSFSSSHRLDYQSNRGRKRLIVAFTRTPLTTWFEVIVVASTSFFSPVHLHPRWLLRSLLLPSPRLPIESNWIEVEEVDCCINPPNPPSHLV